MLNAAVSVWQKQRLTFRLLVAYRWLSLLPPLVWLIVFAGASKVGWWLLLVAATSTLILTLASTTVNKWLLRAPWLLVFDLLFSTLLVWYTGVEKSPYYLYSLAPILAAAFFFQIRGGVLAAAFYTLFYGLALSTPHSLASPIDVSSVVGQVISFFLIGVIFGYPALLLQKLHKIHTELATKNLQLSQRNRDLNLVRELSLVMQSSVDPAELQESILRGLVHELGYRRAMIGLYDEQEESLSGWLTLTATAENGHSAQMGHTDVVSLEQEQGALGRALKGKFVVEVVSGEPPTDSDSLNGRLRLGSHYIILPLTLRGHAIGVILIGQLPSDQRLSPADRHSLDNLATHAGVALGSLRLCIARAQHQAVAEERNRIAVDLHDNVSQALYGTAYGLEACMQMLPQKSEVQNVLSQLHTTVTDAQAQIRKAIFDMLRSDEVTSDAFVAGLHRHLRHMSPVKTIALRVDLPGDFNRWDAAVRTYLYQISKEALANTLKHANARQIIVKLARHRDQLELRVTDDGDGFTPSDVPGSQHLGIQSIAERVKSLGGSFEINSAFGEGTLVIARIPDSGSTLKQEVAVEPVEELVSI